MAVNDRVRLMQLCVERVRMCWIELFGVVDLFVRGYEIDLLEVCGFINFWFICIVFCWD
jgi:hypothetical protein